jgi:hypothetical protein
MIRYNHNDPFVSTEKPPSATAPEGVDPSAPGKIAVAYR